MPAVFDRSFDLPESLLLCDLDLHHAHILVQCVYVPVDLSTVTR